MSQSVYVPAWHLGGLALVAERAGDRRDDHKVKALWLLSVGPETPVLLDLDVRFAVNRGTLPVAWPLVDGPVRLAPGELVPILTTELLSKAPNAEDFLAAAGDGVVQLAGMVLTVGRTIALTVDVAGLHSGTFMVHKVSASGLTDSGVKIERL